MRILWNKFEAAILLDKLIDVLEGKISRKFAVEYVSKTLRKYAIKRGLVIDDKYRNSNGINLQMCVIEYIYTDGKSGINEKTKLFQEIVDLYKNDRGNYEEILNEAKKLMDIEQSIRDKFFSWLSAKVSPAQLSEYYISYADIEQFCLQENILDKKIFELTDLNIINNLTDIIGSNKKFRSQYKHRLSKINTALKYYSTFLNENPNLIKISNDEVSEEKVNDGEREVVPEKTVSDIDDVSTIQKSFIKWTYEKSTAGMRILNHLFTMKSLNKLLIENKIIDSDLLLISDIEKLKRIKNILNTSTSFEILTEKQKENFSAVVDKLIDFRQDTSLKKVSTLVTPSETNANEKTAIYEKYAEILSKNFAENGYQPGRVIYRNRFKNYFLSKYGESPAESDEQIDKILAKIGTQRDGRIFPKQDNNQDKLIDDIVNDIVSAFESGASVVYIEAVYEKYKKPLADNLQIYNQEALIPLILSKAHGKFSQYYTYFTNNETKVNPTEDILKLMKESHQPLSCDEIHKKLWYIPFNKMKTLLHQEKSIVWVAAETYFYALNLPVDETELHKISSLIQPEIDFHGYITHDNMMRLIKEKYPMIAMNLESLNIYCIRNSLGYLLGNQFTLKGPIFSALDSKLNLSDVYSEFSKEHEILTLEELKNFAKELDIPLYLDSVLGEMIRISQTQFVRKDLINFDVDEIDNILEGMCPQDYIPLKEITLFLNFPNIGYAWNIYLVESYLYNFSRKFRLIHNSFSEINVYGAMVRADSAIFDYNSLIIDVLSHSDSLTEKKALQFIVDQGYQQRKAYKDIGNAIQEAKIIKEKRENQEK